MRWKIVPLTPTRDMVARTVDSVFGGALEDPAVIEEVYGAMLAAAPELPDGPIFSAAARAQAEALLNDPPAARAFLERANILGPAGQLVPELRPDDERLVQLRERAELVASNPRGDGTMQVAADEILALLTRVDATVEAQPNSAVYIRIDRPEGYGNVHPEVVADDFVATNGCGFSWALAAQPQPAKQSKPAPGITAEAAHTMGAKGGPAPESERLLFEAWMRGHCWEVVGDWDGDTYKHPAESRGYVVKGAMDTRRLWAAWRDRAALAVGTGGSGR